MLYFSKWKIVSITCLVILAVLFTLPNFFGEPVAPEGCAQPVAGVVVPGCEKVIPGYPSFLPAFQMKLGLDLQGGSHLLMQVDKDSLIKERLESLEGDLRRILRAERIGYRLSKGDARSINVRLRKVEDGDKAVEKLAELTLPVTAGLFGNSAVTEVAASKPEDSLLVYSLTDAGIAHGLQSAVTQSIEVIGRRINELGTNEPVVQRQGTDRILIQFPGLDDPQTLKDLIGTTAKLSFHLVSNEMDPDAALTGRPPAGTKVLFEESDPPTPYLIETRVMVDGENLVDAQAGFDQRTNEPIVSFRFDTKGASRFGKVTQDNVGRPFAIVLDDEIISAPVIREPILGGSGQISGNFSVEGANNLAILLRAGALPAKLTIIEERTVGPGLGADSIEAGKWAAIIGAVLVLVFMILTYGTLGIIANVALTANIAMIVALLSILGATLTLPGIAGIVLTMGMAVDANVLIYERIREERRNGRNIIQSFDAGFKHALNTILDANITTFIAAIILFYLGSGPVRGFAVTLAIGIITTVFTAYTFTRLLVSLWVRHKRPTELPKRLFDILPEKTDIRFMGNRVFSFPISAVSVVASIVLFFVISLNYGIDFKGGTLVEVRSKSEIADISDIRARLSEINVGDVQVQEFGEPNEVLIRVESQEENDNAEQSVEAKVRFALDGDYDFRRVEVVGPTVSGELAQAGAIAVAASLLAIMLYIWIRFEWQFALGAVMATLHDVIITIGMFAIFQVEFTLASIAAILTIVGYSLNDTVVVYDRIRENLRKYKKMAIPQLLDLSINQMLSRTILTSVTTLLALFSLYFLGGEVLASFTFAMIFGIFVGTYSSIFIAAPFLILFKLRPGQVAGTTSSTNKEKEATANTMPVDFN